MRAGLVRGVRAVAIMGAALGVGLLLAGGYGWTALGLLLALVFALAALIPW